MNEHGFSFNLMLFFYSRFIYKRCELNARIRYTQRELINDSFFSFTFSFTPFALAARCAVFVIRKIPTFYDDDDDIIIVGVIIILYCFYRNLQ